MEHHAGIYEKYIKRGFDIGVSLIALIVFSPVFLVLALLVRVKLGSPVIFKQERPGKIDPKTNREKIFTMYKFRSMSDAKDREGNLLPDAQRLTGFGRKLRSTSLDELPELLCILKGDMSLVGPRPLAIKYLPYYTRQERMRHSVRPGLTGLAQVNGRNELGWEQRFYYDLEYVEHLTFRNDIRILFQTVRKVFRKEAVTVRGEGKVEDFDIERMRKTAHGV